MALPTIESPKYFLTIPSTQENVEFRPFLVKEEKVLMLAQEAGTEASMVAAIKDIVKACTFNAVDLYSLAMYDIEYMILQIRSKSVGETASIKVKCDECESFVPVDIDLSEITTKSGNEEEKTIQLTDTIGVTLKNPNLKDYERSVRNKSSNSLITTISSVIESVYDENTVYPLSESTPKEIEAFVDSLNTQQISKIQKWVEGIPKLEHEIAFNCPNGHTTTRKLTGLNDFFG